MFPVRTRAAQTRLIFDVLRSEQAPETAYAESRDKTNTFLEEHKSTATLDICFKDIKQRSEKVDTLDDLILKLSFEEDFKAAIIFLEDAGEWVKTVGLIKSADSPTYTLVDPQEATICHCKDLDFEVEKTLREPKASFGYILVFFRKEEIPASVVIPTSVTTKKRHKPIVTTKKKRVAGANSTEMTSEEINN
jgi:hypothetical protein